MTEREALFYVVCEKCGLGVFALPMFVPEHQVAYGLDFVEASQRTQLIVTTHSDVLVSALSETPEAVVVCEHDDKGSHLRRLEAEKLRKWLEKYSLGDLWLKGQIGGTRW